MTHPLLYKRRNDGKIHTWCVEQSGNRYRTRAGIDDGTIVVSQWTVCAAKRGTTPKTQADAEIASMYTRKRESGYHASTDNVDDEGYFKPMKAHHYEDHTKAVEAAFASGTKVYVQPKLDGMRCIVNASGMWSRRGKPIHSAPHIHEALFGHKYPGYQQLNFDGELYTHKYSKDFNAIISLAKKKNVTHEDLAMSREHLQYHVYDVVEYPSWVYHERKKLVEDCVHVIYADRNRPRPFPLIVVPTHEVKSMKQIDEWYKKYLDQDYEGIMIRIDHPYEHKRTKYLLKYKPELDFERRILDIKEGQGNRSGMAGYMEFRMNTGDPFTAAIMGTNEFRRELLKNKRKYIGKMATIKYQNLTPDGVPRFPIVKSIRDYE